MRTASDRPRDSFAPPRAPLRAGAVLAVLLVTGCAGPARPDRVPLGADLHGRPTLAVRMNGKGPFPFLLDTGAERTMIQTDLADSLGLGTLPVAVKVLGTAGTGRGRMFLADRLEGGIFARRFEPVFELPSAGVTDARGVLGMNVFQGSRLEIDFAADSASVGPSGPAPAGFTSVPARIVRGDLVLVELSVDRVRVHAMIDTGARRTMGNLALARALGLAEGDARLVPSEPVTGASHDSASAWTATVGGIALGDARFERPAVTFSDAPVFGRLSPEGGPALVLGIDLLRTLDRLALDYPRAEVQLRRATPAAPAGTGGR